jgi:hypothetical protein
LTSVPLYLVIALAVAYLALLALAVVVFLHWRRYRAFQTRYSGVLEAGQQGDNSDGLLAHIARVEQSAQDIATLREQSQGIVADTARMVRHVGLVRYNPFGDTGGDYSFALALADATGRGVVLCSLHGRTSTRLYARPLENWVSSSPLSEEEQEAVRIAREGDAPTR